MLKLAIFVKKRILAVCQGRTLGDGRAGQCRRRSFLPPSVFEEDTVDFPEELDTSFFSRVSSRLSRHISTPSAVHADCSLQQPVCVSAGRSAGGDIQHGR